MKNNKNIKSTEKDPKYFYKIIFVLFIMFVVIYLFPWIVINQEYNFFTSLVYASLQVFLLLMTIIFLQFFNDFKYFNGKNIAEKLKINSAFIIIMLMAYGLITQIFSEFLFFALKGFATLIDISFYPEKTIFIIPAFAGLIVFITRNLSLYLPIKNGKIGEHILQGFNPINTLAHLNNYLMNAKNILRDIIIGTLLLGLISVFIYGTIKLPFDYGSYFLMNGLFYGFLFFILDLFLSLKFANTEVPKYLFEKERDNVNEQKKEKINDFLDDHKFVKTLLKMAGILLLIILIGLFLFVLFSYFESKNSPAINDTLQEWIYEIDIDKVNKSPYQNLSDTQIKIFKEEDIVLNIPLILIENYTYPLSSRIKSVESVLNVKYTGETLVEKVSGKKIGFVLQYKNNSLNRIKREKIKEGSNYYYSTDYDASIYLTLYEQGYTNIYSFCRDESFISAVSLVKIICAEKQNTTTIIQITNRQGIKDFVVSTKDNDTFNIIQKRVVEIEGDLNPVLAESFYNQCNQLYLLRLS